MIQPPSWITQESWEAFHLARKTLKAPLTAYAEKLIVMELVRLKSAGHDPQACLDQSIMNSWRDVFPVRDKGLTVNPARETWKPAPDQTPEEKAAADAVRVRVMSAVKRVA